MVIIADTYMSVKGKGNEMTFSERLSKLRKGRGLKQTELAPLIGISWRAYQTYERGQREPQLSTLIALADFYDISLDDLVCRDWPREPEEH